MLRCGNNKTKAAFFIFVQSGMVHVSVLKTKSDVAKSNKAKPGKALTVKSPAAQSRPLAARPSAPVARPRGLGGARPR
jgi:hypothetical protein